MRRLIWTVAGVVGLVGLTGGMAGVWAQHGHGGPAGAEAHRTAAACETEFEKVVGEGRAFGLAFAADQNGYPGPTHVLELKERLRLTAEQEAKTQHLLHAMLAEARPTSARFLEAEARLKKLFADGAADETAVRAAVAEAERLRAEIRLVHLRAHMKTRELLTEEQRRIYHEARWGTQTPTK